MEHKSIQSAIDRRLSALCLPDDFSARVQAGPKRRSSHIVFLRRPLAVAAVLCLMLVCSVGVLASTVPSVHNLFEMLGGQVSSLLQPIERSSIDNGIETTVVAAINDNDTVNIYLSVRDLEGSRIDEHTDLADVRFSSIQMIPMVSMVQFDEKTATATFLIEGMCGDDLDGQKITLSIGAILFGKERQFAHDTGVSVAQIAAAFPDPAMQDVEGKATCTTAGAPGTDSSYSFDQALVPAQSDGTLDSLLPWGTLVSAGVVDHAVHLQVKPDAVGRYAQFTDVYLLGSDVEMPYHSMDFGKCETVGFMKYYETTEYILPLPENADLDQLTIGYDCDIYSDALLGDWSTTFQLESVSQRRLAYPDATIDGCHITSVELSSMGVCVTADYDDEDFEMPKIVAYDKNGEVIPFNGTSYSWTETEYIVKNQFASPIPMDQISRVTIGGVEIPFK